MPKINSQKGIGMVEVLVALVILAIGVLGFTALQLRAVDATSEALNRIQAMNLARDLTERIRANRSAATTYTTNLNATSQVSSPAKDCLVNTILDTNGCSNIEMANYDTATIIAKATTLGLSIKMPDCPGIITTTPASEGVSASTTGQNRACVYVSWGKTTPTDVTTDSDTDCTKNGSYQTNSQCIVMEAY